MSGQLVEQWPKHPLVEFVQHKSGDSKIIKGKQSKIPQPGLVQGYSASGPDIWVPVAKYNQSGIVVSAVGARCGKTFLAQGEWTPIANTHALIPSPEIDVRWLWYLTNNEDFWIKGGAAQPFVKVKETLMQDVAIPPVEEQQRIVKILDQLFEEISNSISRTYSNLKSANEMFTRSVDNAFSDQNAWIEQQFGDVCSFVRGPFGGSLKKAFFVDEGFAVYEQSHAINDEFETVRYFIDEAKFREMKRFEVKSGDLIMSCSGTIGKIAIVPNGIRPGIINQALLKLTPNDMILPEFLKYWMRSIDFQAAIKLHSGGAAIKNIASVKILKQINIHLPSLDIQRQIIDNLNLLLQTSLELRRLYGEKKQATIELKQSTLREAFNGNL